MVMLMLMMTLAALGQHVCTVDDDVDDYDVNDDYDDDDIEDDGCDDNDDYNDINDNDDNAGTVS